MGHVQIDPDPDSPLVDERIAVLVALARQHGMEPTHCDAGTETTPSYLVFPDLSQAIEFMLHTSLHTAYQLGDQVALTIMHPDPEQEAAIQPRGKVSWLPVYTHSITEAWRMSQR